MRLITAEDVIAIIEEKQKALCPVDGRQYVYGDDRIRLDAWDEVLDVLNNIPTVEAEPVRYGNWVKNGPDDTVVYCDQCLMPQDSVCNYCPNCGAKMDLV